MRILVKQLKELINEALLNENVTHWVSDNVTLTPAIERAMKAMTLLGGDDSWYHFRVENRRSGTVISTYIEGYVKKKVHGRVDAYQSVGGDYNIPYNVTPDRVVDERVMISLMITFGADSKTTITLSDVNTFTAERAKEQKVIFAGKGFGKNALNAISKAAETFRYWRKRFDEEQV